MAHCIRGPVLCFGKNAVTQTTLGRLRTACRTAAEQLGAGYAMEPEAICEGGVRFTRWPGKTADDGAYKSVRFSGLHKWPLLTDDVSDATSILVEDGTRLDFFLKALYGAPPFTVDELAVVAAAVSDCFEGSTVGRIPPANVLTRAFANAPVALQAPVAYPR